MPKQIAVIPSLSPADQQYLDEREKIVAEGFKASITAAKALHEIFTHEDGRLWKERYKSFEDYCLVKWGYRKQHGYRLRNCGEFVHELELLPATKKYPKGYYLPLAETHVRAVLDLPKEKQVPFWTGLTAKTSPAELTAKAVKDEVISYAEHNDLKLPSVGKRPRLSGKKKALATLMKLQADIENLSAADEISPLLEKVKVLIG